MSSFVLSAKKNTQLARKWERILLKNDGMSCTTSPKIGVARTQADVLSQVRQISDKSRDAEEGENKVLMQDIKADIGNCAVVDTVTAGCLPDSDIMSEVNEDEPFDGESDECREDARQVFDEEIQENTDTDVARSKPLYHSKLESITEDSSAAGPETRENENVDQQVHEGPNSVFLGMMMSDNGEVQVHVHVKEGRPLTVWRALCKCTGIRYLFK